MSQEKLFTTKLGKTSSGNRSRIWIDGKRLIAAGFTPGKSFTAVWTAATLTLHAGGYAIDGVCEQRKVTGKEGGKPVIDIVGQRVIDTFGKHCERVSVAYGDGVITFRRSK